MDQENTVSQEAARTDVGSPSSSTTLSSDSGIQISSGKADRKPKRVLYCSDGVYEEYSSDEDGVVSIPNDSLVDPKTMNWAPWLAQRALAVCDSVGEKVADFLGITSPKYSYEIEEAARMEEEERAEKREYDIEMAGWSHCTSPDSNCVTAAPQTSTPVSALPKLSIDNPDHSPVHI